MELIVKPEGSIRQSLKTKRSIKLEVHGPYPWERITHQNEGSITRLQLKTTTIHSLDKT